MQVRIKRNYDDRGTNGVLYINDQKICSTIELPWRDNMTGISCIPEGTYKLAKRWSPKYKWHIHVLNVPKRFWILIHPANDAAKELRGCIAPVTNTIRPGYGTESRKAFTKVRDLVFAAIDRKEEVTLIVGG